MHAEDYNASMPNLPPADRPRLKQGDKVVCVDNSDLRDHLKLNKEYEVDADYGDVNGRQCIYLVGDPDNCPYAATRFVRSVQSPPLGNPAAEFAELGMLAVLPVPGAGEQLSRVEQAVFENLMDAESRDPEVLKDNVNLPAHYARFKIEPIRFVTENGLDFMRGNVLKYIMRYDAKNGMEDLRKAKRYLEMFIRFTSGDPDWWKKT